MLPALCDIVLDSFHVSHRFAKYSTCLMKSSVMHDGLMELGYLVPFKIYLPSCLARIHRKIN